MKQRVVVEVEGVGLKVNANVPLPVAITLLEVAKLKLLSDAMTPPQHAPEGTADPAAPETVSSGRAPSFEVRTVA